MVDWALKTNDLPTYQSLQAASMERNGRLCTAAVNTHLLTLGSSHVQFEQHMQYFFPILTCVFNQQWLTLCMPNSPRYFLTGGCKSLLGFIFGSCWDCHIYSLSVLFDNTTALIIIIYMWRKCFHRRLSLSVEVSSHHWGMWLSG